jgi:hypothetical protein
VTEEDSESDKAADPPASPCKIKAIRLFGLFFLLWRVIPGVVLLVMGLSTYVSAESADLPKEFSLPTLTMAFFQTVLLTFAGSAVFFGFSYRRYCCGREFRQELFGIPILVFFFIAIDVVWIVTFFIARRSWKLEPVWSLDKYKDFMEAMEMRQPQAILEVAADDCSTNPVMITGASSTDASEFPNVSAVLDLLPVVVLHLEVKVRWDAESVNLLKESVEVIKRCERYPSESVKVTQTDTVPGWKERVLITKDGELPGSINRGSEIATVVFGGWFYYVCNVDALRWIQGNLIKNDARIDTPATSCTDLEWRCV